MTKQKPLIENFFTWKGLPAMFTLLSLVVFVIAFIVNISTKVQAIEVQHHNIEQTQNLEWILNKLKNG